MRLVLALVLLLLAVAAPARAATIRTIPQSCNRAGCSGGYSVFEAAPGERNDVRVTRDRTRSLIVDAGAEIAGDCERVDAHTARCPYAIDVELGDGDDRATGAGSAGGGEGDDVIDGAKIARGGPGDDHLTCAASRTPPAATSTTS